MAEALFAGAALGAFFNVLLDRIATEEVVDFFKQRKLNDGVLRKLKMTMNSVSGLLEDAEEKQITKPAVRNWLDDLKDVAYDADDLLDEIAYKSRAKQHLEAGPKMPENWSEIFSQERLTTSLVEESGIYGRDGDKEAIVKLLLSDHAGSTCPGVVSVVGMGGIGKTTLAQLIFNDSRVKERFGKLKGWVCVSEEVDVIKLTKNIIKEIGCFHCDSMTLNQLQLELQEKVKGQRILLVMDDVWNNIDWELLLKPLKSVARGSKILVTTREKRVLSKVKGVSSHQLKVLSEEDCWSLFANHAFDDDSSEADADLKELGTKIIRKCKCLPLAVKTIGSLLYSKRRAREWEKILESNMWDLDDGIIIPALKLSYHYLHSHLKQCFAYCAMFPKDYPFKKEELIYLWMGEGLIVQNNIERREPEEIGAKCFEDLCSRSLFEKREMYDGDLCFVMHDLLNDLAKSIAGEFCYNNVEANSSKLTKKTRHVFYKGGDGCNALKELENISKAERLRTLICSMKKAECRHVVDVLPRFGRLRLLGFSGGSFSEEEDVINISHFDSCLKHLRYLELYRLPILNLPETMPYLQTLIIKTCQNLISLPDSIGDMKDLWYLSIEECQNLTSLPDSIGDNKDLWYLSIKQCQKLTSLPDSIGDMKDLRHLSLWKTRIKSLPDSIGNLKDLRHLDLGCTVIERLPESVCGLHSLQHLSLWGCDKLVELPPKMSDLVNLCHLDIMFTKLPLQMGKLIKLQSLSHFIVGKEEGSCIAELGHFRNLQGELVLKNLQNV